MDDVRRKATEEQLGGKAQNVKGKFKEAAGKVTGREDWEAEGEADQVEGNVRDAAGGTVRDIADAGESIADRLKGRK